MIRHQRKVKIMIITVRDYLKQYPDLGLDLLMPAGLVKIPPQLGRELLAPGGAKMKLHVSGTKEKVFASEVLEQQISKIVRYRRNLWSVFMLTNVESGTPASKADALFEQMSFLSDFPQITESGRDDS